LAKEEYENNACNITSLPVRATMQTTERCNLNCIMCQIHSTSVDRRLLSISKREFDDISYELFPNLVEFHPTNIGEPLMSEWFMYLCNKVEQYGVLLDITTNGMLLDEEKILALLPNLLDIKISFDSLIKKKFESIRKNSNFDLIKKNIANLTRLRRDTGSKGTITLQMTLLKNNYMELPEIIYYAKLNGIDRIKAFHMFSFSHEMNEQSLINTLDEFENIRIRAINLANELDIQIEISEPPMDSEDLNDLLIQHCRLPWAEIWIDCDGRVYPCHSHKNIAYGNIFKTRLTDIGNSMISRQIRNGIISSDHNSICYKCGMNYLKYEETQNVPYDSENYLFGTTNKNKTRWSGRSRQFTLNR
jgi:radical SAM protein with 4Fe4S-binding SPASM domain